MHRSWFVLVIISGLLLLAPKTAYAEDSVTWQGEIDGVATWVTIVTSGHDIHADSIEQQPWWTWGNTTSDTYIFAFQEPGNVRLILTFSQLEDGRPMARIYAAGTDEDPLEYSIQEGQLLVRSNDGHPFVTVTPRNGSWLVDGMTNYNLELAFDGIYFQGFGYSGAQTDGITDVTVTVGGDTPGIPDWEVTKLEYDPRPNDGYPRLGMLRRMDDAPAFSVAAPVMPGFPYLGIGGDRPNWFTQNPNPLFFNLRTMALAAYPFPGFQNGGMYNVNSISFAPHVNFEAPFVFYNFDPSNRFAHLVVRSAYSPAEAALGATLPSPRTGIRYSWKTDDVQRWRYGLQLSDFHAYEDLVMLGDTEIVAVEATKFPEWVTSRPWRAVTFLEATAGYPGSEGIYHYSADYYEDWLWLAGQTTDQSGYVQTPLLQETTDLTSLASRTLPTGFRGEYMFAHAEPPELYLSPVDGMLHLNGTQGGIWYLGDGMLLRTFDLDSDGVLDAWSREIVPAERDENGLLRATPGDVIEALYDVGGYLVYSGLESVTIVPSDHPSKTLTIAPPTDKESWEDFRTTLRPFEAQRRDPTSLQGWLDSFPGSRSDVSGASLANVRITEDGFRFELTLEPDYRATGPDLLGLEGLAPGKYLIETQDGAFLVAPLSPAQLSLTMRQTAQDSTVASAQVTVDNMGSADASDLSLVVQAEIDSGRIVELTRQPLKALAGETTQALVDVPSTLATGGALRAWLEDGQGQVVAAGESTPLSGPDRSYRSAILGINKVPVFLPIAVLFAAFLGLGAVLAFRQQRGQPDL